MGECSILSYDSDRKGLPLILAVFWIGGLLCGICYFFACTNSVTSLMHRMAFSAASIVGLLNTAFVPFLLTLFFVAISTPWAIVGVCFVKSFLFSFVSIGCLATFDSGGWIFRYFLTFSDCVFLPALLWYSIRYASTRIGVRWSLISIAFAVVAALFAVLDYRIIAPFACLIDSMKG